MRYRAISRCLMSRSSRKARIRGYMRHLLSSGWYHTAFCCIEFYRKLQYPICITLLCEGIMNSVGKIIFLGIVIPLLLALLIYITCDSKTYLSVFFDRYISIPKISYPMFIRNHGCDLLWAIALFSSLFIIFRDYRHPLIIVCLTAFVFSFLMEWFQRFPNIPGTFDPLDVLVEFLAIISICFGIKMKRRFLL